MGARPSPIQTAEALIRAGDFARARATLEQALRRAPGEPGLNALIARVLIVMGERDRAIYHLERLLSARPGDPAALGALAEQLLEGGRPEEAERCAARLIGARAAPGGPRIASKLAVVMQSFGRHRVSVELGDWARAHEPGDARIASYGAAARIFAGDHAGAAAILREAEGARGVDPDLQRDPLLLMLYCPQFSAREVFEAHRLYGRLMHRARPERPAPIRDPDPDRPLRVGYISQDFRNRSAGHFIEGIVAHHDRARVRPWCYSHRLRVDGLTERVRAHAEGFREIHAMTDDQAAEQIRTDGIDIAVDLTGHTGLNRLGVLATKPAPVQATYMGYAATTGLPAIDYRLVDAHTDPEPDADGLSTERLIRLDPCFLCYTPPAHAPEVSACPAEASGRIVFASFNTFAKITDGMLGAWAKILFEVPGSGLLVKNAGLADPWLCERFRERFARLGGDPARLETLGETPTEAEHMGLYARVDIALDTFPYHGTTTTLEAMWMGVPVVTLEGDSHVSRVGVSLLRNTGMDDLIARDPDAYVGIAARLARDADRRRTLRGSLRGVVRDRLCDFASFVPRLESAYRAMWRRACAGNA